MIFGPNGLYWAVFGYKRPYDIRGTGTDDLQLFIAEIYPKSLIWVILMAIFGQNCHFEPKLAIFGPNERF